MIRDPDLQRDVSGTISVEYVENPTESDYLVVEVDGVTGRTQRKFPVHPNGFGLAYRELQSLQVSDDGEFVAAVYNGGRYVDWNVSRDCLSIVEEAVQHDNEPLWTNDDGFVDEVAQSLCERLENRSRLAERVCEDDSAASCEPASCDCDGHSETTDDEPSDYVQESYEQHGGGR